MRPIADIVRPVLQERGLERLWFSDDVVSCFELPSGSSQVFVDQIAGRRALVKVSASTPLMLEDLVQRLLDAGLTENG